MAEQFPTELRASGIGLSYAIATAVFGGTAPYLAAWLSEQDLSMLFFGYLGLLAAVSGVTFARMRETRGSSLGQADIRMTTR
jgi:MHS family alpha-ketoglutarate permease-like MFS transporter